MARLGFVVVCGEKALSGTAASQTMQQILTPTNQRAVVREASISFKGTSNTASPCLCDVVTQSSAGTGLTSLTPAKWDSSQPEAIQTTAIQGVAQSVEPTLGNILIQEEIHPQTGLLWQAPFAGEVPVPGNTRLGTRINDSSAAVTALARYVCEE